MSSQIRRLQSRLELQKQNAWLRNAFRRSLDGMMEQSDNVAELSRALIVAVQKSGGAVLVTKGDIEALDPNTRLRAETDEHGNTMFTTYAAEAKPIQSEEELAEALSEAMPGFIVDDATAAKIAAEVAAEVAADEAVQGE